ncbi:ThiF family adenylyltransferase [Micromonospora sp. WMMD882]|uniref:ThiF family adenylyltransferase n=1 Tax=Micromonospora sp. WMMD882 TaxID=3015151 RepID=UPI00248AD85D|nr:ThiF family adenylyltransferase [Micromonospora sp. WMMD882]WBB81897.1 ThiF family adenylyltransferase [Micromonospora sp. WMMD882]
MPFPPLVKQSDGLSDSEVRRQAHQLIHPDITSAGQRRMNNSRVLVVGADEVEAPALTFLADAGIGTLGIVDDATLEPWDLPARGHEDLPGARSRGAAWQDHLRTGHPGLATVLHDTPLTPADALTVVDGYDLVLCASEDPALCYLVDDVCARLGKPFVWGGLGRREGTVGVFWEEHGPTYRDLYPDPPRPYFRGMEGVSRLLAHWVALTMATEAVKLLTGQGEPLVGRVTTYDVTLGEYAVTPLARRADTRRPTELTANEPYFGLLTPAAAEAARTGTISVEELRDLLDGPAPVHLVDVREPDEHALVRLPDSVLVPKREFLDGDAAASLPTDRKVVLYCRMGIRSAEALARVRAQGHPDAVHLGGGIIAWAQRIDPSLPTY